MRFCLVVFVCLYAAPLSAQSAAGITTAQDARPRWLDGWSPLAPIADIERTAPGAPAFPEVLGGLAPRVGLFWTGGNPAGLPLDVDDARGELRALAGGQSGPYRRPLDEDDLAVRRITGWRWQPLGSRAAVAGRVLAEDLTADVGASSIGLGRHSADPFVLADTSTSAMRHLRARLEGAYGIRLGAWSVGLAAGLEMSDGRTRESRLPRLTRASMPGVTLGVTRALPGGLRLAAHGRWLGGSETTRLISWPDPGLILPLNGFDEPIPTVIGTSNPEYVRFNDRTARAGGFSMSGPLAGAAWTAFGEVGTRENVHYSDRSDEARRDRWEAEGWRAGLALKRAFYDGRLGIQAFAGYTGLEGRAVRGDLAGRIISAAENEYQSGIDVRYSSGNWNLAATQTLRRQYRRRDDFLAGTESEIITWVSAGGIEAARPLGANTSVALAVTAAFYSPTARIPDPADLGPVYRQFIGPELALASTAARPAAAAVTIRQALNESVHLLARASGQRVQPANSASPLPLVPQGERSAWSLALSILWTR